MTTVRCPICKTAFEAEAADSMPFCSRRCRLLDLQGWLDEQYGLPDLPDEEDAEPFDAGDAQG